MLKNSNDDDEDDDAFKSDIFKIGILFCWRQICIKRVEGELSSRDTKTELETDKMTEREKRERERGMQHGFKRNCVSIV